MSEEYPWYKKLPTDDFSLEQGDVILDCQIIESEVEVQGEGDNLEGSAVLYDVVIMSQSCDLAQKKVELVLVCPFYSLEELSNRHQQYIKPKERERLRDGKVFGFHLLNEVVVRKKEDFIIVDFKNIYSVPLKYLEKIVTSRRNRIRLLPPYKEHLSQSFARFFMRVGLPSNIPSFICK